MPTSKVIKFGKKGMAIVLTPEFLKERNIKVGDTVSFVIFDKKKKIK